MASFAPIRGTRAQIQATPIVDGQFLVETDQGVDNKIYMDEGSTRTIVGGNTVTGVLPELYIYSETGSVVTVEDAGGTLIPTSQVGTDHWICEVPDYGIYNIYSLLDGETTTKSINVDDCMIYTIDDSHFHCNVVVTYPSGVGASCSISGGGETYSAPALNPPDTSYKFVVHGKNTTYTITTNVDGVTKTATVTTGTTLDQTYNVSMPYARVNLTVETPPITGTITCTDGTTTITRPVAANITLYLDAGTWTISGSDGIDTYDTTVEITDFTTVYEADLSSAPNGATVLPTDDIQIWLQCAMIRDKSYTTLDEVLNDNETLQKLISSENAVDYMVRSKTWIKKESAVPIMTSNNTPEGNAFGSSVQIDFGDYFNVFDGIVQTGNTDRWFANTGTNEYVGYEFNSPQIIRAFKIEGILYSNETRIKNFRIEASNDGFTTNPPVVLYTGLVPSGVDTFEDSFINNTAYKYYRLFVVDTYSSYGGCSCGELSFYTYAGDGITQDSTAMRYIGKRNYCADTLLADEDWAEAIGSSEYFEDILNISVPTMTSNTAPKGVVSASSVYSSDFTEYKAFDNNDNTAWAAANNANQYIEYEFENAVKITKALFKPTYGSSGSGIKNYKILASNDDFATHGVELYSGLAQSVSDITSFESAFANSNLYKYYRLFIEDSYIAGTCGARTLQFYGRTDVDESNIDIYSAANDTIIATPQGGGAAITITTDNNGYGTIAKSSLPDGTYTFASSKAKDPSNISNDYTDTFNISNNNTIEVSLMPTGKIFYWYGFYSSKFIEKGSVANGWQSYSGYGYQDPTFNLDNINHYGAGNNSSCIGNISALPSLLKYSDCDVQMVVTGKTLGSSFNTTIIVIDDIAKTPISSTTSEWLLGYSAAGVPLVPADNTMHIYTASSIDLRNKYLMTRALYGMNCDLNALWLDFN